MSAHAQVDLTNVDPWADPSPSQSGYWMGILALFVAFSIFALTYLTWEWQAWGQAVGSKAPTHADAVSKLNAAQDGELATPVIGDKLILTDGRVIDEGKVVKVTDPATNKQTIYVCSAHYETSRDAPGTMVRLGTEELKFTPDQVKSIQERAGKKLTVPISEGMRRYVDAYRSKHGN